MRKTTLNTLAIISLFAYAQRANSTAATTRVQDTLANTEILAQFTIPKFPDPILLPVTLKGEKHFFFLDTGSSHTAFDLSLRNQLGHPRQTGIMMTAARPIRGELFDAPEAFLGPFNLQDSNHVTCCDLKMFSAVGDTEISGIIGMNFLRKYVLQLNFDQGKLFFLKPTTSVHPEWGPVLTIQYSTSWEPYVSGVLLNATQVYFRIDTGANHTGDLHRTIFEKLIAERKLKTSQTLAATAAGTRRGRAARIPSLSFGPYKYKDLIFGEGTSSLLGLSFFSRHIVTFDFPNSRFYLKKSKQFNKTDETDMSGLHLLRISNQTIAYSVDRPSPAHKAGIKPNDIILKVNDKDATTFNIWELRRLLKSQDKRRITMTINREDDVTEVSFALKKRI